MIHKNIIKIEDTYLTFSHYKEPLSPVPKSKGHGFYGCLLSTLDRKFIQCHICGKIFKEVSLHIRAAHKMSVRDYKKTYGLSVNTALISEDVRQERKERTLRWLSTLSETEIAKYKQEARKNSRKWHLGRKFPHKESLESKNKKGTCPDQILAKIKEVAQKIGHVPSIGEFIEACDGQRFFHLILRVYGKWSNAVKLAGFVPKSVPGPKQGGGTACVER